MSQPLSAEPHWYEQAECRGRGWTPYFDAPDPTPAQRICTRCPVRVRCLQFALSQQIENGIWGGLTPEQRRRLRASQRVA